MAKKIWKAFIALNKAFWTGFGEGMLKYMIIATPIYLLMLLGLSVYIVAKGIEV